MGLYEQNELMKKVIVKLNNMVDYTYGRTLIILIKNGLVSPYMGLFVGGRVFPCF